MRPRIKEELLEEVDRLVKSGTPVRTATKQVGIGHSTYYRYLKEKVAHVDGIDSGTSDSSNV